MGRGEERARAESILFHCVRKKLLLLLRPNRLFPLPRGSSSTATRLPRAKDPTLNSNPRFFSLFLFFLRKLSIKSCPPFVNWPFSRRRGRKDLIKSGRPTRPQTTLLLTSPPTRRSSFGIRAFLARNGREMDGWKDYPPLNSKWFSRRENG